MFAHNLLSAFAVLEEPRVLNLPLELLEAFAFELDKGT
jgi:hypothetical protein